jgi:hypothetical protein
MEVMLTLACRLLALVLPGAVSPMTAAANSVLIQSRYRIPGSSESVRLSALLEKEVRQPFIQSIARR